MCTRYVHLTSGVGVCDVTLLYFNPCAKYFTLCEYESCFASSDATQELDCRFKLQNTLVV